MAAAGAALLLLLLLSTLATPSSAAFNPADNYLINCGSAASTAASGRTFSADSFFSAASSSTASYNSSSSSPLYNTARIFPSTASYSFPITRRGRHFLRLYFFPFPNPTHKLTAAAFSVSADGTTLLTAAPTSSSPALKEYLLNLTRDTLTLTFAPSPGSPLAFINAIEVVSVPDDLIQDTAQQLNPPSTYQGLSSQPLETLYRVNMGGPVVSSANDTLWRSWVPDQSLLRERNLATSSSFTGKINYVSGGATAETAPDSVYRTATRLAQSNTSSAAFNVTWELGVDSSLVYLVRMHFCDVVSSGLNLLYFNVYVDGRLAIGDLDLSARTLSLAAPYYADFVVGISDGSGILRISIGPSKLPNVLPDGILNGLEVMKIGSSGGGFGGQSPTAKNGGSKSIGVVIGSVIGAVVAAIFAVGLFVLVRRRRKGTTKQHSRTWVPFSFFSHSWGKGSSKGTTFTSVNNGGIGLQFSFNVLQEATGNFDENWVVGVGGFGKVYKGELKDGTKVAVKRGNPKSQQGLNEFRTEIELLSRLRHRHLVSLIGYCDESSEMILVYEYMENGTLKSRLYGSGLPCLSWKQRLEACIGSAKGLHYLHTGQAKAIIHRDVKSANILLDENLMAKVADFGLSKTGPELDQTHVSTAVKGSFGYLDPEYFRRQQLTDKSDVYSFGVVLLEVLCARPVIDPTLPREKVNLAEWAMKWQKKGELDKIVDPHIANAIRSDSLRKFGETAEKCLAEYGVDRPTMGDVLWNLEYAMQLQEAMPSDFEENSINQLSEISSQVHNVNPLESNATLGSNTTTETNFSETNFSDASVSKVFSQLIKAEGR